MSSQNTAVTRLDSSMSAMSMQTEYDEDEDDYQVLSLPDVEFLDDVDFFDSGQEGVKKGRTSVSEWDDWRNVSATSVAARIPFSTLHKEPQPFDSNIRRCFLPGQKIEVEIIQMEQMEGTRNVLNPIIYHIRLRHGQHEWMIFRRYKDFRHLHEQLMLYRAKITIPMPHRTHRDRRKSFHTRQQHLPRFPLRPDALIFSAERKEERKGELQDYLRNVLRSAQLRNHKAALEFLEVSHLSFVYNLGSKKKEGLLDKQSGGRHYNLGCCRCCGIGGLSGKCCTRWAERWFMLRDTFIAYLKPRHGTISDVILMDKEFGVKVGWDETKIRHGLQVKNLARHLQLKCATHKQARRWRDSIQEVAQTSGKDFTTPNRHESFAPERNDAFAQWFVDGASYMTEAADALEMAREEIFMTDWWLSPQVYMKRPNTHGDKWRFDCLIKKKAEEGVKIFIMLYKEMEVALGINSYYTKQTLMKLHPENIKVLRNPDGISFWAHHEKMIVIDQRICFMGGVDICYGRWDTPAHRLSDLGSVVATPGGYESRVHQDPKTMGINSALSRELDIPFMLAGSEARKILENQKSHPLDTIPETEPPVIKINAPQDVEQDNDQNKTEKEDNNNTTVSIPEIKIEITEPEHVGSRPPNVEKVDNESVEAVDSDVLNSGNVINKLAEGTTIVMEDTDSAIDEASENVDSIEGKLDKLPMHKVKRSAYRRSFSEGDYLEYSAKTADSNHLSLRLKDGAESSHIVTDQSNVASPAAVNQSGSSEDQGPLNRSYSSGDEPMNKSLESAESKEYLMEKHIHDLKKKTGQNTGKDEQKSDLDAKQELSNEHPDLNDVTNVYVVKEDVIKYTAKPKDTEKVQSRGKLTKQDTVDADSGLAKTPSPKYRSKRPHRLRLGSISSLSTTSEHSDMSEEDIKAATKAGLLPPPGSTGKPTTPKPRRKFTEKAERIKEDLRNKFRGFSRSQSVDVKMEVQNQEFDFETFRMVDVDTETNHRDPEAGVLTDPSLAGSKLWIGKDYCNFITKNFVELDKPFSDFIDRTVTPRMPWHDIAAVVYGKPARDIARHFIQRWNFTKLLKVKYNHSYPLLVPKSYNKAFVPVGFQNKSVRCNVQVLRSACKWSLGIESVETSIYRAYLDLIENAQHYIFIENQFFISIMDHDIVENGIAEALYYRIVKAHEQGQNFRVYVVMPLLPSFEGEIGTPSGTALQAITHWNYSSICKGNKSLMARLSAHMPDTREYITFCGLRTHEEMPRGPVSELVYVHSKLMIVDDRKVIIGSANINDRSLLGKRDSELAILVEDTQTAVSVMDGQEYQAGFYATSLRKALFREHLGLLKEDDPNIDIRDPVCKSFYKDVWYVRAATNTLVYDKVFHCIPTDCVRSFSDLRQYQQEKPLVETDVEEARQELKKVKGNIVMMPLDFLCHENLTPAVGTKESFAPTIIWT